MAPSSLPPPLVISPPLVNTANPSATNLADLTALYDCPFTGAVTTRTSLLKGFPHDPAIHQYTLFDVAAHDPAASPPLAPSASLNCLGYSPLTLDVYLGFIAEIAARPSMAGRPAKGFIVSVTGSPEDVTGCYRKIAAAAAKLSAQVPLAVEVNLSCPNIPNKPPPAYDGPALEAYLKELEAAIVEIAETKETKGVRLPVGLKTPPYTHAGQFATLIGALKNAAALSPSGVCPISFLTATNTLGSCLVMTKGKEGTAVPSTLSPAAALPGPGFGGLAGAPLHPLALGNVATLRTMLDAEAATLGHVQIVGAGGVADAAGFERMRSVGAFAAGVGTGILLHGVDVFGKISAGIGASAKL